MTFNTDASIRKVKTSEASSVYCTTSQHAIRLRETDGA